MAGATGSLPGGMGVVVLRDTRPAEPLPEGASLASIKKPTEGKGGPDEGPEPKAPKFFDWALDSYYME